MSKFTSAYLRFIDPLHTSTSKVADKMDKKKAGAPAPAPLLSPKAGEDTVLTPGQKTNLIATSPQGVLTPAQSNKQTLLGG